MATDPNSSDGRKRRKVRLRPGNNQKSIPWQLREGPIADMRRKAWREKCAGKFKGGRPKGVCDGFTKETAAVMWTEARESAEKTMNELIDNGVVDAPIVSDDAAAATEALTTSITIMRSASHTDLKLKAARQVLEWTKAKPEQRVKATVQSAEDWLSQVTTAEQADPTPTPE
jgi:hypothetical protein